MSDLMKKNKTWISSAHQGYVKPGMHSNTLDAFYLAAKKGADMIETDARMTKDGVLIANHDPEVKGYDADGRPVKLVISETDYAEIAKIRLTEEETYENRVPTLEKVIELAYYTGMCINIDLKEGILHAKEIAQMVVAGGMRGRTVYATNGAGADAIRLILEIDPEARFIDTPENYTKEALSSIEDYPARCFAYTGNFSDENIARIRKSGCMLAAISLHEKNAAVAFRYHPDMAEYPHTSDFEKIDDEIMSAYDKIFE